MVSNKMIKRSKERIEKNGEVFTPLPLVDEILDKLPQELFTDPNKTFLDPAAGDGNFLVRVLQRKIDNGSPPIQALQTTYGIELMQDNVNVCKQRLLDIVGDTTEHKQIVNRNIVCADTLKEIDNILEKWDNKPEKQYKTQWEFVNDVLTFTQG